MGTLKEDINAFLERDPAARSGFEIFMLYPGFRAIRMYRRAHKHYLKGHFFRARFISQRAARKTGIEIHPGAKIGRRFVIDHGVGIVIGETAEIGDDVLIYQGVTLGGTGKDVGKRHPTVGNRVMISAGAKVLGPINIGDGARIAAGAVVLKDVPAESTVVGVPAKVVKQNGKRVQKAPLDQINIPDPVQQEFEKINKQIKDIKNTLREKE